MTTKLFSNAKRVAARLHGVAMPLEKRLQQIEYPEEIFVVEKRGAIFSECISKINLALN